MQSLDYNLFRIELFCSINYFKYILRDKTYMVMQANKKSNILQLSYNVYYHIDEIGVCLCLLCFCFDFDFFFAVLLVCVFCLS